MPMWPIRVRTSVSTVPGGTRLPDGEAGKPYEVHFKAEFEVNPSFELGEYRGLKVPYVEPMVTDEDIDSLFSE